MEGNISNTDEWTITGHIGNTFLGNIRSYEIKKTVELEEPKRSVVVGSVYFEALDRHAMLEAVYIESQREYVDQLPPFNLLLKASHPEKGKFNTLLEDVEITQETGSWNQDGSTAVAFSFHARQFRNLPC